MHIAWKIYLIGWACIGAFFLYAILSVLSSHPPPEEAGDSDAMMGPVFLAIVYGVSSICVWNGLRTTKRYLV